MRIDSAVRDVIIEELSGRIEVLLMDWEEIVMMVCDLIEKQDVVITSIIDKKNLDEDLGAADENIEWKARQGDSRTN